MPFLAYVAVVLVSIAGILLEIDWLTRPKLDTKSPAQVASTVVPVRTVPKVDGPAEGPSPVNTKKQEAEPVAEGPAAMAKAELKADIPSANPSAGTAPAVSPAPFPPVAAEVKADAAPPQTTPQLAAQAPAQAPAQATLQPAANQAPNSCDVQACASAYQSFRASDCTYQPMEGPRKFCERPPAASQRITSAPREPRFEQTARRPSRDAELRDVERAVRSITAGDDAGYESRNEPRMGRSEVIVIERLDRGW